MTETLRQVQLETQPRRRIPGGADTPVMASGSMGSAAVSRKHVLVLDTRDTRDGEVPMNQVFFDNLLPEESWTRIDCPQRRGTRYEVRSRKGVPVRHL